MLFGRRSFLALLCSGSFFADAGNAFAAEELKFTELYTTGVDLTPKAKALAGKEVTMRGFMAPPLKAEVDFFCPDPGSDGGMPVLRQPDGLAR